MKTDCFDSPKNFYHNNMNINLNMGNDCFWSNMTILLEFLKEEVLALPYLDIACMFQRSVINENFLEVLEAKKMQQGIKDNPFFHTKIVQIDPNTCLNLIRDAGTPLLIKVNLKPIGRVYSAFPEENSEHFIVTCGLSSNGRHVLVADRYFGFLGNMSTDLIIEAISSLHQPVVYEITPITQTCRERETALKEMLLLKMKEYTAGNITVCQTSYLFGYPAIKQIAEDLDCIWTQLKGESASTEEALSKLSRRIDIFLSRERAGIATYLELFGEGQYEVLQKELVQSTYLMKKVSITIVKGQLTKKTEKEIMNKMTRIFEQMVIVEGRICLEIKTLLRGES